MVTVTAAPGKSRGLGCRHRANDRLGQLSPRSQSDPAHEAPVHRRSVRHRGKHGDLQVESDSNNVQDLSVRPEVDPTEQAAGQSDVLNNPDRITDWGKLDGSHGSLPNVIASVIPLRFSSRRQPLAFAGR